MDVITTYLYGTIDKDIFMKILEGIKLLEENNIKPHSMCSVKLQRSLYGLKHSKHKRYNHLSEYLLKEGYVNNPTCPCTFINKLETGFAIIDVYVDLNLFGTLEELTRTTKYLKKEFEMECSDPQAQSDPKGESEPKPGDARFISFILRDIKFSFSKMPRPKSPTRPK